MTEIIPAIMPESFDDLKAKMREVADIVGIVQIDVMDGIFVPPTTWPYRSGQGIDLENILNGSEDMPFWKELEFEVDMMVTDQEEEVSRWIRAGARRVIGHVEAMEDIERFIKTAKDATVPKDSPLSAEIGLAVGSETSVDGILPFIEEVDLIQLMGIKRIGYQGEEFDERVVEKVSQVRKISPGTPISVDGGVDEDSAPILIEAGADRLVSGSMIFKAENKGEAVKKLLSL